MLHILPARTLGIVVVHCVVCSRCWQALRLLQSQQQRLIFSNSNPSMVDYVHMPHRPADMPWRLVPVASGRWARPLATCLCLQRLASSTPCWRRRLLPHGQNAWARPSDEALVGPLVVTLGIYPPPAAPPVLGGGRRQQRAGRGWRSWGSTSIGSTSRRVRPLRYGGVAP